MTCVIIFNQLQLHMHPQAPMQNINLMIHQSLRIAKLNHLIGLPSFANCNTLLTPIATFGCFSIQRIKISSPTITNNQSINAVAGIILQCAFCNAIIHLSDMLSSFSFSNDTKCTLEFIATLSTKHKAKCYGLKAANQLSKDEVQFGVMERSLNNDAVILSTSMLL